ncbi:MAG: hypothetical protein V3W34_01340 [Phycisphaerae bacterium]
MMATGRTTDQMSIGPISTTDDFGAETARPPANPVVVALGWLLVIISVAVYAVVGHIAENVRLFQAAYLVGFAGFAMLVHSVWHRNPSGSWPLWFAGCLAIRLALLHTPPSDDLYRYLWEGLVQAAGHNPFLLAPDDPALATLRDQNWQHINHRDYTAIYPPLAQLQFFAVARVSPNLLGIKLLYVLFDVFAVWLLAEWLKRVQKPPHLAIVYALCPITITAVAIEGHLDSAMIAMLAAAGLADARRRPYLCAACLAAAVLTKVVPIFLLPWLARKNIKAAIFAVALILAGYLPYLEAGPALFHSLIRWPRGNEMLSLGHGMAMKILEPDASRVVCVLIIIAVALWQARRPEPLGRVLLPVFGACILFMPIVHYWYLTWVLLALSFSLRVSWLVLCATMVFYFEATLQESLAGAWNMPRWVSYATYTPFVIVAAAECVVTRSQRLAR